MKYKFWNVFFASVFFMSTAHGYEISAGLREYYSSLSKNSYSSDAAAKLKMGLTDLGLGSITLGLRLGAMADSDSSLFLPVLRSDQSSIELMISRIIHGNAVPVLKPTIHLNPRSGTPQAIVKMAPGSVEALLSSYQQILSTNLPILTLRSVREFVLGSGMGVSYHKQYSKQWKAMLEYFKSRSNPDLLLSLEISDENALSTLEEFKREDPGAFFDTWGLIDKIRFSLPLSTYLDPRTLKLQAAALQGLLLDRLKRIHSLLPNRKIGLSNLFLPACFNFISNEAEVECVGAIQDPAIGFTPSGEQAQGRALQDFFAVLDQVETQNGAILDSIELMMGSTQDEPFENGADPRFLYYNPVAGPIIKAKVSKDTQKTVEIDSPARSSLSDFNGSGDHKKKACIYFDELNPKDAVGAIHARMLENLIGAFPGWKQERRSIRYYQSGDLSDCDTVFYLASNFVLEPPSAFAPELVKFGQTHTVTWFNYKFDLFSQAASGFLKFKVPYLIQPDSPPTPANPDPGFFRYFDYKGETFEKLARWDPMTHIYSSSPELGGVQIEDATKVKVLAVARHSKSGLKTPYVVEQDLGDGGAIYYFADLPFSYNHYEDRYFIFCDVIYDILREKPPEHPPVALVRIEDVNPSVSVEDIAWVTDYLADHSVPFSMAVIPYYSNLFQNPILYTNNPVWKPVDEYPEFTGVIKYAKARGATMVIHGLAHQAGDLISGFAGVTASDYEFWSWPANLPHPQDRTAWVLERLKMAEVVANRLGIKPIAWEVPHYAASALDYVLFGKVFEWNYHRGFYFKSEIRKDVSFKPENRMFECKSRDCEERRRAQLDPVRVDADYRSFGGQIFPYPIYRDSYGQSIIPESLGMIDFAFYSPDTWRPVSFTEDLLRRAKKLKVVRGAMASFFWHPILLNQENQYYQERPGSFEEIGGTKTLTRMIEGLKALGYEFRSIGDCDLFPRKDCAPAVRSFTI